MCIEGGDGAAARVRAAPLLLPRPLHPLSGQQYRGNAETCLQRLLTRIFSANFVRPTVPSAYCMSKKVLLQILDSEAVSIRARIGFRLTMS